MMAQCSRINVSFKHNERDQNLFTIINSKNDKSAFIKECVEFYLNSIKSTDITKSETKTTKRKVQF
ncbi:MAG: hypothetical protein IJ086_03465 [Clostridium sp.]|nr:hypothetical protein [Clostridium sp.]